MTLDLNQKSKLKSKPGFRFDAYLLTAYLLTAYLLTACVVST